MKCPECKANTQSKSAGSKCKCGYLWVLNPKTDGMSDMKFTAILKSASRNGSYYYTRNQLYAEAVRKTIRSPRWPAFAALVVFGLGLVLFLFFGEDLFPVYIIMGFMMLILGIAALTALGTGFRDQAKLNQFIDRFRKKHPKMMEKLVDKPQLGSPPPNWSEEDIYDYGVEKVLIVERDEIVDLMVLNNFHSEQKAVVVSESGYPKYLMPKVQELLTAQPELPVFVLHDSTPHGVGMKQRLLDSPKWLMTGRKVVDLGVHPTDVKGMKRMQALKPAQRNYEIPLDFLLIHTLSAGVALAMTRQCPLSQLMHPTPTSSIGDGTSTTFESSSGEAAGDGDFG